MARSLVSLISGVMTSKSTKRKQEYNKLVKKYGVKKVGSYAQWHQRMYGKYKKTETAKSTKSKSKSTKSKDNLRTKAIKRGIKETGADWEKDRPSRIFKRSK